MNYIENHAGIFASLILAGAVLTSAFLLTRDAPVRVAQNAEASPTNIISNSVAQKDSDGDGLLDWEENLWGMDPQKVDTDGDGILDGDEVTRRAQETNEDELADAQQDPKDLTFTAQFSREFFANYLSLREEGQLDDASARVLLSEAMESLELEMPDSINIKLKSVSGKNNKEIDQYLALLESYIVEFSPETQNTPLELAYKGIESGDQSALEEINRFAEGHTRLFAAMKNMQVPEEALQTHKKFMLASDHMQRILPILAEASNDPLRSLVALKAYAEAYKNIQDAVEEFRTLDIKVSS